MKILNLDNCKQHISFHFMNKSCKSKWMSKSKIAIVSKPLRRIIKQMTRNGYQLFKKCDVFKNANGSKSTNYSRSAINSRNTNNAKSTNSKMTFGNGKTVQVVDMKRNSKKDKSTYFHFNKSSGIDE